MVCIFKNDAHLWKPFRCCSVFPLQMQLGRHKCSSARHKRSSGRSVSETAPYHVSETYVCMNTALFGRSFLHLRKKPYDSRKKPSDLRKKPSGLRWRCTANAFRKGVPNRGINFKDMYRKAMIFSGQWACTHSVA